VTVRGYILIESEVGKAKMVRAAISEFSFPGAQVVNVDTVTGPYDVIVLIEAENLDILGNAITEVIQQEPGVQRTTTCLAVNFN